MKEPLIEVKREYNLIKTLTGKKFVVSTSIVVVLLIINMIFYGIRIHELAVIRRNSETHISSFNYKGQAQAQNKRVKNTRLFEKCKSKFNNFCIYGECMNIINLDKKFCICNKGYTGNRCDIVSIR
ncbi:EGF-like protein [Fowlpox virus]|uniref:Probable growth factor FPV211 n=2 Tax=Fowlpox virus TaxID=10261 RepID=V211_FOWPN|nr:EGF-like protein [Fowlpox virus]Q9J524.1 RecName: Full=Probable growth factor FPV211; Flags: Precursor [Fowlpox virus strain NVSL]UNS14444.1 ALPV-280 [Albatrosspox virus]WPD91059.1 EGF-like protein [Avipoxvirus sp.]CAE52749.1 hypothetical C11R-like protein [Fowlpox virus isolate HP-438/Munich]AAF44555.1 ORF FPV211 EGF-like protein vaccinia C11R [Fowlpox virus]ART91644.1 EGF-like protein vaccinia C11R [Fowlpox virus]